MTHLATLIVINETLAALTVLANQSRANLLSYLLSMASLEAAILVGQERREVSDNVESRAN